MSVLQALYESEINASVSWFWDCGFTVKLGDPFNGYLAEGNVRTWEEVEQWFILHACLHFPDSAFAQLVRTALLTAGR